MRAETVQTTRRKIDCDDAAALAIVHDQVVLERLLVERMEHCVAGAVGRGAGALRGALAEMRRHAAERSLVNLSVFRAREWHAVMLELDYRVRGLLAHVLDRILIAQPVRSLDRVVHVPAPVVLAHVAQRGRDTALRGYRVAARRENLGDAGRVEAGIRKTECRAQTGADRADDDDVITVIDEFVIAHAPIPSFRMANTAATARNTWAKREMMREATLRPWPWT